MNKINLLKISGIALIAGALTANINANEPYIVRAEETNHSEISNKFINWFDTYIDENCYISYFYPKNGHADFEDIKKIPTYEEMIDILDNLEETGAEISEEIFRVNYNDDLDIIARTSEGLIHNYVYGECSRCHKTSTNVRGEHSGLYESIMNLIEEEGSCGAMYYIDDEYIDEDEFLEIIEQIDKYEAISYDTYAGGGGLFYYDIYYLDTSIDYVTRFDSDYRYQIDETIYDVHLMEHDYDIVTNICDHCGKKRDSLEIINEWFNCYGGYGPYALANSTGETYENIDEFLEKVTNEIEINGDCDYVYTSPFTIYIGINDIIYSVEYDIAEVNAFVLDALIKQGFISEEDDSFVYNTYYDSTNPELIRQDINENIISYKFSEYTTIEPSFGYAIDEKYDYFLKVECENEDIDYSVIYFDLCGDNILEIKFDDYFGDGLINSSIYLGEATGNVEFIMFGGFELLTGECVSKESINYKGEEAILETTHNFEGGYWTIEEKIYVNDELVKEKTEIRDSEWSMLIWIEDSDIIYIVSGNVNETYDIYKAHIILGGVTNFSIRVVSIEHNNVIAERPKSYCNFEYVYVDFEPNSETYGHLLAVYSEEINKNDTTIVDLGNVIGQNGVSVVSIEKTSTEGNIDTYTITLSNGETTTFTIKNGKDGKDGEPGQDGQPGQDGKESLKVDTRNFKKVYEINEQLDLSNLVVTYIDSNKISKTLTKEEYSVSNFSSSKAGYCYFNITYKDLKVTIQTIIKGYKYDFYNDKYCYYFDEDFSKNDFRLFKYDESGEKEITNYEVDLPTLTSPGVTELKISYQDFLFKETIYRVARPKVNPLVFHEEYENEVLVLYVHTIKDTFKPTGEKIVNSYGTYALQANGYVHLFDLKYNLNEKYVSSFDSVLTHKIQSDGGLKVTIGSHEYYAHENEWHHIVIGW